MSVKNFILKVRKLQWPHLVFQKVLLLVSSAMLSPDLYAQRYRLEYDDVTPTPWWLSTFILLAILVYLWVKKKVKIKGYLYLLLSVVLVVAYTLMLLYKWFFYALLVLAVLAWVIYVKWRDKIDYIKRQINMDTSLVLFTSFVALLGLQMCVPENPNGRFEAQMNERYWTQNPLLRIFYGLSNIAGVIFVLGMVAYLTISEHWWYLIVYLVALPMAKLLAFICKLGVLLLWKKSDNIETFSRIKKHRIVGSLVIITAIITFFFDL